MKKVFKFYKYQSLSNDIHFEYLNNYLDQKVWLVPLGKFNDPFEGKFSFLSFSTQFILSNPTVFAELLKKHQLNGEQDLTREEFKTRLLSKEFKRALKNDSRFVSLDRHGALCLTRKNNSVPMWAYYADNHKGYCVEFELEFSGVCKSFLNHENEIDCYINGVMDGSRVMSRRLHNYLQAFVFTKVRYSETIPSINFDDFIKLGSEYKRIEYIVQNSVGVKSLEWKHEDEYRLIANGNSEECGLLPLEGFAPFLRVTGIVIGDQMEESFRNRIIDLSKNKNIKVSIATCSDSLYKITVLPYKNREKNYSSCVNSKELEKITELT